MADTHSVLQTPSNGFWAGIVAGLLILSGLMALNVEITPSAPAATPVVTTVAAAESLVKHWERMSTGMWVVDSTFARTLSDGRTLNGNIHEAQRPPDYLRIGLGTTDARVNGRRIVCAGAQDPSVNACRDGGAAPDFNAEAAAKVEALRALVLGYKRTYDVAANGDNCFRLFHRPARIVNAWGEEVRFCFDPATGAQTLSEFHRNGNVDAVEATSVRGQTTPQDFQLPETPPSP